MARATPGASHFKYLNLEYFPSLFCCPINCPKLKKKKKKRINVYFASAWNDSWQHWRSPAEGGWRIENPVRGLVLDGVRCCTQLGTSARDSDQQNKLFQQRLQLVPYKKWIFGTGTRFNPCAWEDVQAFGGLSCLPVTGDPLIHLSSEEEDGIHQKIHLGCCYPCHRTSQSGDDGERENGANLWNAGGISHKIPTLGWLPPEQDFLLPFYVSKWEFLYKEWLPLFFWCSREDAGVKRRKASCFSLWTAFRRWDNVLPKSACSLLLGHGQKQPLHSFWRWQQYTCVSFPDLCGNHRIDIHVWKKIYLENQHPPPTKTPPSRLLHFYVKCPRTTWSPLPSLCSPQMTQPHIVPLVPVGGDRDQHSGGSGMSHSPQGHGGHPPTWGCCPSPALSISLGISRELFLVWQQSFNLKNPINYENTSRQGHISLTNHADRCIGW